MLQYISNWNNFLVISCCVMLNLTRAEYFSEDLVEFLETHSVIFEMAHKKSYQLSKSLVSLAPLIGRSNFDPDKFRCYQKAIITVWKHSNNLEVRDLTTYLKSVPIPPNKKA